MESIEGDSMILDDALAFWMTKVEKKDENDG